MDTVRRKSLLTMLNLGWTGYSQQNTSYVTVYETAKCDYLPMDHIVRMQVC